MKGMTAHYLLHRTYAVQPEDTILVHAAAGGKRWPLKAPECLAFVMSAGTISDQAPQVDDALQTECFDRLLPKALPALTGPWYNTQRTATKSPKCPNASALRMSGFSLYN
jgi:hypothetical protein